MPGFDGTGPGGSGPNGRGFGPCGQGYQRTNRGFFGFGRGRRGGGRGFWPARWGAVAPPITDEKSQLDSEKQWLSQQLDAVNKRLQDLEQNQ